MLQYYIHNSLCRILTFELLEVFRIENLGSKFIVSTLSQFLVLFIIAVCVNKRGNAIMLS